MRRGRGRGFRLYKYMLNKNIMDELDRLGFGADIDALECYVEQLQDAAGMGSPLVDDSVYDYHVKLLKSLKPNSQLLNRNWEVIEEELVEYDELLDKYGMSSITTITSMDELSSFKSMLKELGEGRLIDLTATIKENGHACRIVYVNGELVSGTTRGRYKKGRDITRHLKLTLPNYVEQWKDVRILEIRGEVLVAIDTFETHLKNKLKTPLSSVTSLIRESATDEEIKMLDVECFKIFTTDDSELKFKTLWDELEHLRECGFKTPLKAKIQNVGSRNFNNSVEKVIKYFEKLRDDGHVKYSTDGIVLAIDDNDLFYSLGMDGNTWKGNFAVKMGKYWESNVYSAVIKEIVFINGKTYITPKAIVDPVVTSGGAEVTNVPLYNVGVMERYKYIPGETIYFRFGGEQGVTACDVHGNSVRV